MENKKIIYPMHTASIISELMKKYQLQETGKDFFEKIARKESTNGNKTLKIIMKIAEGEIPLEKLNSNLQQELSISKDTAKKLGQDIQNKIIDLIRTDAAPDAAPEKQSISEYKKPHQPDKIRTEIKPSRGEGDGHDAYREPIE